MLQIGMLSRGRRLRATRVVWRVQLKDQQAADKGGALECGISTTMRKQN